MNKHIKKFLITVIGISLLMSMMLAGNVYGAEDVIGGGSLSPGIEDGSTDTESEIVKTGEEFPGLPQELPMRGDLDNNKVVDSRDAIFSLMNTMFPKEYLLNQNGDFNGDGTVNSEDSVYLLMSSIFPQEYPLEEYQDFPED